MQIRLHRDATTTPMARASIRAREEPAWALTSRHCTTEQTVWEWRGRDTRRRGMSALTAQIARYRLAAQKIDHPRLCALPCLRPQLWGVQPRHVTHCRCGTTPGRLSLGTTCLCDRPKYQDGSVLYAPRAAKAQSKSRARKKNRIWGCTSPLRKIERAADCVAGHHPPQLSH